MYNICHKKYLNALCTMVQSCTNGFYVHHLFSLLNCFMQEWKNVKACCVNYTMLHCGIPKLDVEHLSH